MYNAKAYSAASATSPLSAAAIARRDPTEHDFCGAHGIAADVEVIPIQKVNEAYGRFLKADVKYRFSIDMASLQAE